MEPALRYGLYTHLAARRGYVGSVSPAVWAYATCDANGTVCGATDGQNDWPQAALIVTPSGSPEPRFPLFLGRVLMSYLAVCRHGVTAQLVRAQDDK